MERVERYIDLHADHIAPNSFGLARVLKESSASPESRITTVPDGVNLDLYRPEACFEE